MRALAVASLVLFVGVGGAVGIRLLALSLRTGELPEQVLGGGLCGVIFLSGPALGASLGGGLLPPFLEQPLFLLGIAPVGFLAAGVFVFTGRVFRYGSRAASTWVALACLASLCVTVGFGVVRTLHWRSGAVPEARPWVIALVSLFAAGLGWTAVEALAWWRRLRRRVRVGLADPLVANRFFLWGFGSCAAVGAMALLALARVLEMSLVLHPLPQLVIGLAGTSVSVSWGLAFLPPPAYRRWIRRRRPADSARAGARRRCRASSRPRRAAAASSRSSR